MTIGRGFLLAALMAATPLAAEAQRLAPLTGDKLVQLCQSGNERGRVPCDAYISGVADGIAGIEHMMSPEAGRAFAGATCIPRATSAEALRGTVVAYLRAHPDDQTRPAAVATFRALHDAYPCKASG